MSPSPLFILTYPIALLMSYPSQNQYGLPHSSANDHTYHHASQSNQQPMQGAHPGQSSGVPCPISSDFLLTGYAPQAVPYGTPPAQNYYGQIDPRQAASYYQSAGVPPATNTHPGMYQQQGYAPTSIQYIQTPPQSIPGPHHSTNSSPFTTVPRAASTVTPQPARFTCEICGGSFSRLYDRKRHHETLHAENPTIHRCTFCQKEFARGDSLKRHQDGGCEKMQLSSSSR